MSDNEIIIAVAKLDGYTINGPSNDPSEPEGWCWDGKGNNCWFHELEYLTSRDTIIPVIEKVVTQHEDFQRYLMMETKTSIGYGQCNGTAFVINICATPRQLCIALLKATGNWKD